MSTDVAADPFEMVRKAREAGIERLRELRDRHAAEIAVREQLEAEHKAELARAEAEFAEAAEAADQAARVAAARNRFDETANVYRPLAADADEKVAAALSLVEQVTAAFADAILAERARDESGQALRSAFEQLRLVDDTANAPHITALRLHKFDNPSDVRALLVAAAITTDDRFSKSEREGVAYQLDKSRVKPRITANGVALNH